MQFKFISPGSKEDRATRLHTIRSHVAIQHNQQRRRKQQQKSLDSIPTLESLCRCNFAPGMLPPNLMEDVLPPANGSHYRQKPSAAQVKRQRIADSYKFCVRCKKLQFLELSHSTQTFVMRKISPQVVAFFQDFDPFGMLPENEWCMKPREMREMNEVKYFIVTLMAPGEMKAVTLPAAIRDPCLYMCFVFCGFAWLAAKRGLPMSTMALALKLEALRHLNTKLRSSKDACTAETLTSIGYLATGVRVYGGDSALSECTAHQLAIVELLKLRKGNLAGLDDTPLGKTLRKVLVIHHIVNTGLSAREVSPVFLADPSFTLNSPLTAQDFVFESPFYKPRTAFFSLEQSKKCSKATLNMLYDMEELFTALLKRQANGRESESTYLARLGATYSRVLGTRVSTKSAHGQAQDHYYEACRFCALITLDAMVNSRQLSHAPLILSQQLIESLKHTDLGDTWGDMLGVLHWIAMTATAACTQNPEHQFMDSTLGSCQFAVAYKTRLPEARTQPTLRFAAIHLAIVKGPMIDIGRDVEKKFPVRTHDPKTRERGANVID